LKTLRHAILLQTEYLDSFWPGPNELLKDV